MITFLLAAVGLLGMGMVSTGPAHPARDQDEEILSGEQRFGRVVQIFTIIATLVMIGIVIAGILSVVGVFGHDRMDPPV